MSFDYLITGATGFIGRSLAKFLVDSGHKVLALDVSDPANTSLVSSPLYTFVKADLKDYDQLKAALGTGCKVVFHLAGQPFVWYANKYPREDCTTNVMGTLNLLEVMRYIGITQIVYASTGDVYRDTSLADEESMVGGANFYGLSKSVSESYIRMYAKYFQLRATVVRMALVYGPGFNRNILFDIIDSAHKNQPVRLRMSRSSEYDMLYVADAVAGLVLATGERWVGRTVNLSTAEGVSVGTMIETVSKLMNKKIKVESEEKEIIRKVYTNYLARELGWHPRIFFFDGCRETLKAYQGI